MGGWDSDLDCSVIMQRNPGWGIMVNFITTMHSFSRGNHLPLLYEGALLDRRTTLDNLVGGMKSWSFGIWFPDLSSGGAELVKSRVRVMRSFDWSWKFTFLRAKIFVRVRLVPILTGQIGRIRGLSWPTENGMIHFRRRPFTQRSMSYGQKTKSVLFIDWTL